ncbi:MAG: peptide-methionine (S)-S-oxide reductase [Parcubacteria bacterium C7867-004]|nr:MAG: peptide-methionine (S)-S-oxide reductase [Parcubacteria bacterium C7867-004]
METKTEQAIFAAGCFWGVEAAFLAVPGVTDAESGYTGGHTQNPTYGEVCTDTTGHAEAVRVTFDPETVSFETLVRKFFTLHDPTQVNRQGPDVGSQYRSGVFYLSDEQKEVAEKVKSEYAQKLAPKAVATEVTKASEFFRAEEYHQRYFEKHPSATCHI